MKRILFILAIILLTPAKCFATADARISSQDIKNYGCYTAATVGGMTCYSQAVDVVSGGGGTQYAEDVAHMSGDAGTAALVVRQDTPAALGADGDYTLLQSDANGRLHTLDANSAATAASASVVDDWDNAASDGASISGDVAHDSADAGEPVKIGAKAVPTDGTDPGEVVSEDDRVNLRATLDGLLLTSEQHPFSWSATEAETAATTNDEIVAAPGANLSLYVCTLVISNGATAGDYKLVEDTAGTPVTKVEKIYTGVTGGAVVSRFYPCIRITPNKNIGITSTTVTTGSYTVTGFTAP